MLDTSKESTGLCQAATTEQQQQPFASRSSDAMLPKTNQPMEMTSPKMAASKDDAAVAAAPTSERLAKSARQMRATTAWELSLNQPNGKLYLALRLASAAASSSSAGWTRARDVPGGGLVDSLLVHYAAHLRRSVSFRRRFIWPPKSGVALITHSLADSQFCTRSKSQSATIKWQMSIDY